MEEQRQIYLRHAVTHVPVDVEEINSDLLLMSAHKFYGQRAWERYLVPME